MSLILEALRKSEAERRRGQLPDLHAELPPLPQSARSRRAAWPWLLAMAILVLVALAWFAREPRAPTPPAAATTDQARSSPPDIPAQVADAAPEAAPVSAAASDEPPSVREERPGPESPPPDGGIAPGVERPAPIAAKEPATPARAPSVADPATAPIPLDPTAADRTSAPAGAPERLLLSDLAPAERRGLPPLKISMHMWAPTSAGRFAIIDGARVNEGDRLGDAVVDEITRDGVVLAWRGRRVQIPIH